MMNKISWVVFDVGGVIFDFKKYVNHFFTILVNEYGYDRTFIEKQYFHYVLAWCEGKMSMQEVFAKLQNTTDAEEVRFLCELYLKCFLIPENRILDQKVVEIIEKVKAKKYKVGVISDASPEMIQKEYCVLDIDSFDYFLASCEFSAVKTNPNIFLHFLEKVQTTADAVLFIDDSAVNIAVAKELGLQTIHFTNTKDLERTMKQKMII